MRLIDADALMQSLGITSMDCDKCAWCDKKWSRCGRGGDFEDACCAIEDAPTIDAIDRQAAIEKLKPWLKVDGYSEGELNMLKAVLYELRFLPSAQPEIIHCESCEHWKNEHLCECLSRHGTFETPKNFYCGYGKAK